MRVVLKPLGFNPGAALRRHVSLKVCAALAHWTERLGHVVVRVADANGPRGGLDKVCSIHLRVPRRSFVVVTAVASDYYAAVDLAVGRACRAVARAFERRFRRKGPRLAWPDGTSPVGDLE